MKKCTTHDIAELLQISRTTVSKALNDHPDVPPETKKRVKETALQLGYKRFNRHTLTEDPPEMPEAAASPMPLAPANPESPVAEPTSQTVAFLIRSNIDVFQDGFWSDVLRGVVDTTRQHQYNLIFGFVTPEDLEQQTIPSNLSASTVSGVILVGITREHYLQAFGSLGLPLVAIDCCYDLSADKRCFDTVLMESEQSMYDLTHHLAALGHREIGFIGDVTNCRSFSERWVGFRRALLDLELPIRPEWYVTAPSESTYFYIEHVREALNGMARLPTALVCANDMIAFHTIRCLEDMGLQVPKDISVVGFDRMEKGWNPALVQCELTTAEVIGTCIGARAFEQLQWRIAHRDRPYEDVRIGTRVVLGSTTGPARIGL